jgi:two-component system cell cycle response regulator
MASERRDDRSGAVEAGGGSSDLPPGPEERDDETLSALRIVPASTPSEQETVFERRERRETPMSAVLLPVRGRDRATLTILSGMDSGSVRALHHGETILGRSQEATMSIDEPSISRSHARIVRTEAGAHVIEDLGSKNGTFVNGRAVNRLPLRSGDRIQLGPDLLLRFALVDEREEALQRRLYESSTRDALTGLANRRNLFERLELEIVRGQADDSDTGLLMIDVDHFKAINDTFGHLAGDQVLRALATSSVRILRAGDLFARYGGEEFVAMICNAKKDALVALAERVRVAFGEVRVELGGRPVAVTVSIGVALASERASASYLDLVALADERMYVAKLEGRNRVCSSGPTIKLQRVEGVTPMVMDLRTLCPPGSGTQSMRAGVDSAKCADEEIAETERS